MTYIVAKQLKSTGIAAFLAVLFGGIGLFYSTILGGVVMTLLFPILILALFFFGKFLTLILLCCSYYLICLIWAIAGVSSYNKRILRNSGKGVNVSSERQSIDGDNYYENYRRSMESDNTVLWILITIIIAGLLFYGMHNFVIRTECCT